ncbi:DUF1566 domain-containing protein [uncultured Paraglaciecola sp.]|uniref:Lcl C-terminal domain-containing protein n=1 Tax=uncultured Paraglaciecola sp. TaxID=1765024 RepID=UPI0030D75AB8|tara:strand:+ start:10861 stop:11358 length:498 start_codon:yes stop_codon:yes gene_type:complete
MKKFLILALLSLNASAQTCLDSVSETANAEQFVVDTDGTATHTESGLMWMRCSLGQTFSSDSCIGEADELNWQQALDDAHGYTFAGLSGWRVPNIKELATLTERACVRPAINETVFPNTLSDDYWTSTPSVTDASRAWVVAFFNSSNALKEKRLFVYTRLVRTVD